MHLKDTIETVSILFPAGEISALAFYGFLRASEFATTELTWPDLHMENDHYTVLIHQSKTDPFHRGHVITIHASGTSTCPVQAMHQYASQVPESQRQGPLFHGGWFSPLTRLNLTVTLCGLLQQTHFDERHFASHSF